MPVVDASVVVDWVAPDADPRGPAVGLLEQLSRGDQDLLAPSLLGQEVANALLTGTRRRRWTGAEADEAFALFRRMPVRFVDGPGDLGRAWELSRRHDEHPLYDMVYVAVAMAAGQKLVTADGTLARRLASTGIVVRVEDALRGGDGGGSRPLS